MINWLSTEINPPEAGREIIAKNPDKQISNSSSVKQCRVMKFHPDYDERLIKDIMLGDNLTQWGYTE